ncbi:MAG: GGDEF domain-containing protein [Comamonas sp.]
MTIPLPLDTPTMMVMVTAGTMALAVAMAVVRPDRREGIGLWALALVANAVTYLLFMTRGWAPNWISMVLANSLLATAFALLLAAVSEFHGRTPQRLPILLPIAATAVLMTFSQNHHQMRLLCLSFLLAVQIGLILWALWRPEPPRQRRGALLISVALGTEGVLLLGRGLWYAGHEGPPRVIMSNGLSQSLTFLTSFIVVQLATLGFILMTKDRAEAINHALANNDMLTGIANRRLLQQTLRRDTERAMREHAPYAVLMVDIDHFKSVNDTHGHLAGDTVLRHVAHLLQARVRGQDMVGRWGGEEFLVLLPATTLEGARQLAEAVRASICDTPSHYNGIPLPVTVSIGICAEALQPGDRARLLVEAADKALYAAKQGGRNRVESAPLARMHVLPGALAAPARVR